MKPEPVKASGVEPRAVRAPARAPRWVVPLVKALLVVSDIVLTTISFAAAFSWRHSEPVLIRTTEGALAWSSQFAPYAVLLPLVIPIRLLLLRYYDLYRLRGEFSFVDDAARRSEERRVG